MSEEHQEPVNEYEREPVPPKAWLGLKDFVRHYAGAHTAGTELMMRLAWRVKLRRLVAAGRWLTATPCWMEDIDK